MPNCFSSKPTIFGRAAHGETVRSGLFTDRWRIRRGGRLLFADDLRFDWADAELLGRPAVLAGAARHGDDPLRHRRARAASRTLRAIIGPTGGASAWNGKLLARIVADSGAALRRTLIPALALLLDGAALPRIWRI